MAIAQDEKLLDHSRGNTLPACWTTIYELTKLTSGQFERDNPRFDGLIRFEAKPSKDEELRYACNIPVGCRQRAKVDELMTLCERLEASLPSSPGNFTLRLAQNRT